MHETSLKMNFVILHFVCVCVCVCVFPCECLCACMYKCGKFKTMLSLPHAQHNVAYLSSKCDENSTVRKLKIKTICHLYMTQIFTCLKSCYISSSIKTYILKQSHKNAFLLYAFSFNHVVSGGDKRPYKLKETCRKKLQICLNVHDLLLPPGINGVNSHKNHSMIPRLIINCMNY